MIARKKKPSSERKIREEDVANVLKEYSVTTVLTVLHEISHSIGNNSPKIDWDELVKKTTSGISKPKEYQMLWRHLAYGNPLPDPLLPDSRPRDDESDLECEVEASPTTSFEISSEASAVVKVLMASGSPSENTESMIEAPMAFNVPYFNSQSMLCRLNTSVPILLQKQALPGAAATTIELVEKNGSNEGGSKKKRKNWTKDEDVRLYKAVRKHGAGNWAIIATEACLDRTATQLSQRWAHIRRKNKDLGEMENECSNHLSEAQEAARHAMNLALDPPSKISHLTTNVTSFSRINPLDPIATCDTSAGPETSSQSKLKLQNLEKKMVESNGVKVAVKGGLKVGLNVDPVRAAAVAAGARIATPSDAACLIKAAQAKHAVHIIATGAMKGGGVGVSTAPAMVKGAGSCESNVVGECGQKVDVNGGKNNNIIMNSESEIVKSVDNLPGE